jgi:hypothetical protein
MRKTQLFSMAMDHPRGGGGEEEELYSGGGFSVHTIHAITYTSRVLLNAIKKTPFNPWSTAYIIIMLS